MFYKIWILTAHLLPVLGLIIWFILNNKYKQKRALLKKEAGTRLRISETKLKDYKPDWIFYTTTTCPKEKTIKQSVFRDDKTFQKLYSQYVFAKLDYFELNGMTFYEKDLFEILEISTDPKLSDKAINYLIKKNDFYLLEKKSNDTAK
ncbi:MAG TPA: hypothetical protein PK886_02805 [Candidatus Paceibacterota bacterium]|nr:hypothetical protein [Candidatus Paceibacterota bacterium]